MPEVFVITVAIIVWSIYFCAKKIMRHNFQTISSALTLFMGEILHQLLSQIPFFNRVEPISHSSVYFFVPSRTSFTQTSPAKGPFFVQILKLSVILEVNDDLLN